MWSFCMQSNTSTRKNLSVIGCVWTDTIHAISLQNSCILPINLAHLTNKTAQIFYQEYLLNEMLNHSLSVSLCLSLSLSLPPSLSLSLNFFKYWQIKISGKSDPVCKNTY